MKYITTIDGKDHAVEIIDEKHVRINDKVLEVDFMAVSGQPVYSLLIGGQSYEAYVYPEDKDWQVLLHGRQYQAEVQDEREKRLKSSGANVAEGGEFHLRAPMPGLVVSVQVQDGDPVKQGQVLVILESMKMQNELKSPKNGLIQRLRIKAGESVEQKQTLLSVL